MSDHPNESADKRELGSFAANHRSAAPVPAERDALQRVATDARQRATSRGARGRSRSAGARRRYRFVGTAVAAVLVVGAVAFSLTPRFDDSAFARERAVAALLPKNGVLHARATYTSTGRTDEFGETAKRRMIGEDWIDADRQTTRGEAREISGGRIMEMSVRTEGKTHIYAVNVSYDVKKRAYVALKTEQLLEGPATDEITSPAGGMVDELREAITSKRAKVVDRVEQDGAECWMVEWEVPGTDGGEPTLVKATMAASDYALKYLEINTAGKNGNGNWTGRDAWEWDTWEVVSRDSLPTDFFSLDAPLKLAKPGTKIEVLTVP